MASYDETIANSAAITRAQYDDETRVLKITFTNGQTYDHPGVPKDVYDGLIAASSPGSYWHRNIKGVYG